MRGVWFRFATELRTRWAGWLALAALVGVFYGAVLAAAAGAERTDTIVARSINSKLSPDVFMVPAFSDNGELLDFESIRHFPEVERAARLPRYGDLDGYDITGFTDVSTLESTVRLLEGRLPDPANAEEVLATFVAREARGVQVGDLIQLHLSSRQDGVDGEPASAGRTRSVRVVGVAASLVDFVAVADPGLFVTPAFGVAVTGETVATDQFVFVLRHHEADLPAFRSHMTELTGGKPVFFVEAQTIYGQVKRSFHVQAEALWILAGFLVFIVLVVSTQMFARVARLEARDDATLASLGMTRRQTWAPAAFRGIFIGAIAAVVAAALAVMASLFTPFGRPRSAEPAPGVYVPLPLLAAGVLAVLLVVVVQNALPVALHRQRAHVRHARLGPLARVMPGGPAARAGFQFAIEPGRGADAIPARSGIAGLTVAVVAVLISLTAASSLTHLLATPRLYGWGWDATVQLDTAGSDAATKLEALPGVAAISYGTNAAKVLVADVTADLVSLAPGLVNPVMIEGRRPSTHDEVALAPKTASAADARIGSTVMISIQGADLQRQMHVTGIAVLPVDSDDTTLGEGVLMTDTALQTLAPGVEPDIAFVRFTPDADVVRLRSDIAHVVGDESAIAVPSNPSTLVDFGRVRALPLILAGLLGFLGLATIGHVLFSTVHRRRHDLAVLSMLGFTPRELRLAILWNAVALTAVALLVGLPLGVAAGRWVWTAFAHDTGFVAEPITLPLHVIGVATAVIVCALGVAWQASRGIGRASRGTTLHAE